MSKQRDEKWFTDIEDELRRTGCGPDCEGPTPANERADQLAGKKIHTDPKTRLTR
ncbi:MAG: hypothetical protein ACM3ZQ_08015 [Bacillota bacterium]